MVTKFIEVTQAVEGGFNHGKFMLGRFAEEWNELSALDHALGNNAPPPLLRRCGWMERHLFVLDLQTGEGAIFLPGGSATADLDKHKVWVCPMFEPFLVWLYAQDLTLLDELPELVELPEAPASMVGYRRDGG